MASPSRIAYATATGDMVASDTVYVRGFELCATSSNATAVLKAGGSSGTTLITVSALANTSMDVDLHGAQFPGGVHVTLTGTGATATLTYF